MTTFASGFTCARTPEEALAPGGRLSCRQIGCSTARGKRRRKRTAVGRRAATRPADTEPPLERRSPRSTAGEASPVSEGEQRLMLAALEDALRIIVRRGADRKGRSRRDFVEERAWVLSNDEGWPFSFLNICDAVDIDPKGLRTRLAPWLAPPREPSAMRAILRRKLW
jgi:hypothetical protein